MVSPWTIYQVAAGTAAWAATANHLTANPTQPSGTIMGSQYGDTTVLPVAVGVDGDTVVIKEAAETFVRVAEHVAGAWAWAGAAMPFHG